MRESCHKHLCCISCILRFFKPNVNQTNRPFSVSHQFFSASLDICCLCVRVSACIFVSTKLPHAIFTLCVSQTRFSTRLLITRLQTINKFSTIQNQNDTHTRIRTPKIFCISAILSGNTNARCGFGQLIERI